MILWNQPCVPRALCQGCQLFIYCSKILGNCGAHTAPGGQRVRGNLVGLGYFILIFTCSPWCFIGRPTVDNASGGGAECLN